MTVLTPSPLWKDNPRQLLTSEFNFAANFDSQNQDVLNQSESVKNQLTTLSNLLNMIEERTNTLTSLNSQITTLRSQLNLSGLTTENNAIQSRLTATDSGFNTVTTAKNNAVNATLAAETKLQDLTLDTKVQRANPLLNELVSLSKVNSRNLTIASNNAFSWSLYAGVRVRPQVGLLMENQAQGVNGGSVTANAWQKRKLNTIKYINIDGGILDADNNITLPAGNYILMGFSASAGCGIARSRIQQTGGTLGFGASANQLTDGGNVGRITNFIAPLYTAFSLSATTQLSYDFLAATNPSSSPTATQGRATGLETENYAQLLIISATPPI
jgi:hypothetical protein